jgi:hypothetical protein
MRGDSISAIAVNLDRAVAREVVTELTRSARQAEPDLQVAWRVSQGHPDPETIPRAFNEAKTALAAAHRFGGDGIYLYEEPGIARLLLGSGDAPDLQAFVRELTGPLIEYDSKNDRAAVRCAFSSTPTVRSGPQRSACSSTTRPCGTGWDDPAAHRPGLGPS